MAKQLRRLTDRSVKSLGMGITTMGTGFTCRLRAGRPAAGSIVVRSMAAPRTPALEASLPYRLPWPAGRLRRLRSEERDLIEHRRAQAAEEKAAAARSVTFLGGQSGPPSIGGIFDLVGPSGAALYRVNIPVTELKPIRGR